jgi:hypothetical protein
LSRKQNSDRNDKNVDLTVVLTVNISPRVATFMNTTGKFFKRIMPLLTVANIVLMPLNIDTLAALPFQVMEHQRNNSN